MSAEGVHEHVLWSISGKLDRNIFQIELCEKLPLSDFFQHPGRLLGDLCVTSGRMTVVALQVHCQMV